MNRVVRSFPVLILVSFILIFLTLGCTRRTKEYSPPQTPAEVIATAEAMAAAVPSYDTWIALGLAYSNARMHQKALDEYKRAAVANPKSTIAHNNACSEYIAVGQLDLAIASCKEALALDPTYQLAKNNLERATSGKTGEADKIAALEQAVNSADESISSEARINLGLYYYGLGDDERAVRAWEGVGEKNAHYAVAQSNLASAYIRLKRFDKAKKSLKRALKLDPTNALFLNNLKWLESASKPSN